MILKYLSKPIFFFPKQNICKTKEVGCSFTAYKLLNTYAFCQISNIQSNRQKLTVSIKEQKGSSIKQKNQKSKYQNISNQGQRIQVYLANKYHLPQLISIIQSFPFVQNICTYNPYLASGSDFQEFPLIKLLHIGLKQIHNQTFNYQTFKNLEMYIRIRLHRCTIQQNLQLLYIMLKIYPKYKFKSQFIISICMALKKQRFIMDQNQIKAFYYILHVNHSDQKKYNNEVISKTQNSILQTMINKIFDKNEQIVKQKRPHFSLQPLHYWVTSGLILTFAQQLTFNPKILRLMQSLNHRYLSILKQNAIYRVEDSQIAFVIQTLMVFYDYAKFYQDKMQAFRQQPHAPLQFINFYEETKKLNQLILPIFKQQINRLLKLNQLSSLIIFNFIIKTSKVQYINQYLNFEVSESQTGSYKNIKGYWGQLMKIQNRSEIVIYYQLEAIIHLIDSSILTYHEAQAYYKNIDLSILSSANFFCVNQLVKVQLLLWVLSGQPSFQPQKIAVKIILQGIQNHPQTYRHFDWYSTHFLKLLTHSSTFNKENNILSNSLPTLQNQNQLFQKISKLLHKINTETSFYDNSKLIREQKQIISKNKQIDQLRKFFIQIKVHEMKINQTIIAPFQRIVHFANSDQKLAINAYNQQQINRPSVQLEKKLLSMCGWCVININIQQFVNLTIGERLSFIAQKVANHKLQQSKSYLTIT